MEMRLELWRSKRRVSFGSKPGHQEEKPVKCCFFWMLDVKYEQGVFLQGDDWEEEDYCTISPNWIYDKQTQHWRRINSSEESPGPRGPSPCEDHQDVCSIHSSSSTDSERHDGHRELVSTITAVATDEPETSRSSSRCSSSNRTPSLDTSLSGPPSPTGGSSTMSLEAELSFPEKPPRKKCTTLLRKMEKLRLKGAGSGHSRTRRDISGPVLVRHKDKMYRQLRQLK